MKAVITITDGPNNRTHIRVEFDPAIASEEVARHMEFKAMSSPAVDLAFSIIKSIADATGRGPEVTGGAK